VEIARIGHRSGYFLKSRIFKISHRPDHADFYIIFLDEKLWLRRSLFSIPPISHLNNKTKAAALVLVLVDTHAGLTNQLKDYLVGFWNYYQNNEYIQKALTEQVL